LVAFLRRLRVQHINYRTVNVLIQQYGDEALSIATKRANALANQSDTEGAYRRRCDARAAIAPPLRSRSLTHSYLRALGSKSEHGFLPRRDVLRLGGAVLDCSGGLLRQLAN
jgi:hypothetical protein